MQVTNVRGFDCNSATAFGYRFEKSKKNENDLWKEHFEREERKIYLEHQRIKDSMPQCADKNISLRTYGNFLNSLQYLADKKYDIYPIAGEYKTKVKELNDSMALAEYEAFLNSIVKHQRNPHAIDIVISQPSATYNYYDNGRHSSEFAIKVGDRDEKHKYTYDVRYTHVPHKDDMPQIALYSFIGEYGPMKLVECVDKAVDDMFSKEFERIKAGADNRARQAEIKAKKQAELEEKQRTDAIYNKEDHKSFRDTLAKLFK